MESAGPIKVGVITDQTGPLSFMGIANANVAKMVIADINAERRPAGAASWSCTSRTARPPTAPRKPRPPSSSRRIRSM